MNEHTANTDQVVPSTGPMGSDELALVQERLNDAIQSGEVEVKFEQTEAEVGKEDEATLVR